MIQQQYKTKEELTNWLKEKHSGKWKQTIDNNNQQPNDTQNIDERHKRIHTFNHDMWIWPYDPVEKW